MSMWVKLWLGMALTTQVPTPGGLTGLQPPDPKVQKFEQDLLQACNDARQKSHQSPLTSDAVLHAFAHQQAAQAVDGSGSVAKAEAALEQQKLAPFGHRLQYVAAATAADAFAQLRRSMPQISSDDNVRLGLGSVYVPAKPPYFQAVVLLVAQPDPMLGKPGLSAAQTDPVLQQAQASFITCYNDARKTQPNLRGDVLLQLVIEGHSERQGEPHGRVGTATALRSLHMPSFDACILQVARSLAFPQPYKDKPVTLLHPMRFTPPNADVPVGVLSAQQIDSAFAVAATDFKQCYTDAVPKAVAGRLTLAGVVGIDGAWKSLDMLHDSLNIPALAQCVLARAHEIHFPPPTGAGEVQLTYPVRFGP